jgi:hypothetical protein
MRMMKRPPVAGTLECVGHSVWFHPYQIIEVESQRLFDFPRDFQFPGIGIENAGLVHVVAHEEMWDGSDPGIEKFRGHLQIEKARRPDDHSLFARNDDRRPIGSPSEQGVDCARRRHRYRDCFHKVTSRDHRFSRLFRDKYHEIKKAQHENACR